MALAKCKECGNQLSKKAKSCPHCGAVVKKTSGFTKLVALLMALGFVGYLASSASEKEMAEIERKREISQKKEAASNLKIHKKSIVYEIETELNKGNTEMAAKLAKKYEGLGDPEMDKLYIDIKTAHLVAELKGIPESDYGDNLSRYEELLKMHPGDTKYKNKVAYYQAKINREKEISRQFSSWDGSHNGVERAIKERMNDPDSYEHVETRYRDDGDTLFILTTIRGNNSFGAKVMSTFGAKVSTATGRVLSLNEIK